VFVFVFVFVTIFLVFLFKNNELKNKKIFKNLHIKSINCNQMINHESIFNVHFLFSFFAAKDQIAQKDICSEKFQIQS